MTARILLIDDEPDSQDLFRQNFRREVRKGVYKFGFASSGDAALDLLKDDPDAVKLVVSDINMPGMSGIKLLQEVRSSWPGLPVMMVTANGDADTEARVRALGAETFLTKPVDFERLKREISHIVGEAP